MKTAIEIFTKKRTGKILKEHGYKLQNPPLHSRSANNPEDHLNRYVKYIEVSHYTIDSKVSDELHKITDILTKNYNWYQSNFFEVGSTCMGYIATESHQKQHFFWKN